MHSLIIKDTPHSKEKEGLDPCWAHAREARETSRSWEPRHLAADTSTLRGMFRRPHTLQAVSYFILALWKKCSKPLSVCVSVCQGSQILKSPEKPSDKSPEICCENPLPRNSSAGESSLRVIVILRAGQGSMQNADPQAEYSLPVPD